MNKTNLWLDIAILFGFLAIMEPSLTGLALHEWLSLACAATIFVHILLHWNWIVGIGAKFFKTLWRTSRLKFLVDVLLFVAFTIAMLSGILISRILLNALGIQLAASPAWGQMHSMSADASLLLMGLHFALNWNWVVQMVKKYILCPIGRVFKPRQADVPVLLEITNQKSVDNL